MSRRCCDYSSVPPFREDATLIHTLKETDYPLLVSIRNQSDKNSLVHPLCPKQYPVLPGLDKIENQYFDLVVD
tara:strand:+ start:836 stop:1054 length:219 start_codon:yes stop_codon:yes gene_type:complete